MQPDERSTIESIETRLLAGAAEYRLPRRDLGPLRWAGVPFILVGLLFTLIAGAMSIAAIRVLVFHMPMNGSPPTWPLLAVMLLFVIIGLAVCTVGLGFFTGYSKVRLDGTRLIAINTFGPYRWKRKGELAALKSLTVSRGEATRNGKAESASPLADLSELVAEFEDARKPMIVAVGYPSDLLLALGRAIGEKRGIDVQLRRGWDLDRAKTGIKPLEQPKDSNIAVRRTDDQLTLSLPPLGVRKGSGGLFSFTLCWLGMCVLFAGGIGVAVASGSAWKGGSGGVWIFALVTGVFWLVGIGTLLGSLNMGRRRAIIDVLAGQTVLINRQSLFGLKQHQWSVDEIKRIVVGPSGMTVNNRAILQLQFYIRSSGSGRHRTKKIGMFAGRDNDELDWLAETLNHELGRD